MLRAAFLTGALTLATVAPAAAQSSKLTLLGEGKLELAAKRGQPSKTVKLTVANVGTAAAMPEASYVSTVGGGVDVRAQRREPIEAGEVVPIAVTLTGLDELDAAAEGQLVVKGGAEPVARTVTIAPVAQPLLPWPEMIVGLAILAAVLLRVGIAFYARRKQKKPLLDKRSPGPKWKFDSWASTATATGAILATVLGDATLPTVADQVDKETLVGLSLLFGGVVVVAPFVFQARGNARTKATDQEAGLGSTNRELVLACSLIFGAVLGELATLGLLVWEAIGSSVWTLAAELALVYLAWLTVRYVVSTTWILATTDWEKQARADKDKAKQEQERALEGMATAAGSSILVAPVAARPRASWGLP